LGRNGKSLEPYYTVPMSKTFEHEEFSGCPSFCGQKCKKKKKKNNLFILFLGRIKISKNAQIFSSILEKFRTPSTTALGVPYFSKALVLPGAFPYT
jgi:hypothetical protein